MQYECTQCGQMQRFWRETSPFETVCPNCETETTWRQAFEGDGEVEF